MQPEEPPRNFPRLNLTCRLLIPLPGTVTMFQSVSLSKFPDHLPGRLAVLVNNRRSAILGRSVPYPPTMDTFSRSLLSGPASRTSTFTLGSSANRPATTLPVVPPLNPELDLLDHRNQWLTGIHLPTHNKIPAYSFWVPEI